MKWTNRGHQLDHVKSIYGEKTKIYIYGAENNTAEAKKVMVWQKKYY